MAIVWSVGTTKPPVLVGVVEIETEGENEDEDNEDDVDIEVGGAEADVEIDTGINAGTDVTFSGVIEFEGFGFL